MYKYIRQSTPEIGKLSIKLPPFWVDKSSLSVCINGSAIFKSEETKYAHIVSQLDAIQAAKVEDILTNLPMDLPYNIEDYTSP